MAETVNADRGFLDFSPGRRDDQDKENDVPVLSLIEFTKPPFVSFGSVKLGTSKSAVLRVENPTDDVEMEVTIDKIPSGKGFSVDRTTFIIEPESSYTLTVTWTPTEEGGVRELIVFNANGVLKHQAILLGRANAPKRKKRSLWDSIKSRKAGNKAVTPRTKKAESNLKMGTNKTFQVSRNSQYQRDRNHSSLALLNKEKVAKHSSKGILTDSCNTLGDIEHKTQTKKQNESLSPIRMPETFKKLMPRIEVQSPPPANDDAEGSASVHSQVLSLTNALIIIGSDLSPIPARAESTSESCELTDSLESQGEKFSHGAQERVLPESPEGGTSNQPRLTFFISKKAAGETGKLTKAGVNSATVTKGKAPVVTDVSGGRRVKKSRRRLMEKTLELSDSSNQSSSAPGTPSLPVIQPDPKMAACEDGEAAAIVLPDSPNPSLVVPSAQTPLLSLLPLPFPSPTPVDTSSPLHCKIQPTLTSIHENKLPTHLCSKKRKSEEFLKADVGKEAAWKEDTGKRTRVVDVKPVQQRKKSVSQQPRTAGTSRSSSSSSLKSSESARAKRPTCRASAPVKSAKVVAVAQSKLTFIRPMPTALPRHPMPFAAKNMFYDERWIEKQERGFTWWVNYVLTPEDFKVNTEVTKVNAVSLALGGSDKLGVATAPTKEEMSFSTYTARRKLNRLRRSACQLFTSEAVVKAIQRLELEVEARRLLVRKDRHLWKDIGERRKVLDWLLSYNPLWLRIGLETVYGELISLESNSDTLGLAMFILQRLLWNPDIAAEFRHPRVPNLYRDGHEEALSRFTLKKLLLLVCFLDRAKESRLIQHDPCLFCVDAEFKSSKDLLLAFSRDFLSGEGILSRHLGYLGFPVSHIQAPLDEFDFAVKNLSVDLKCGIRLVRVVELLVQDWSLSAKLRLPAVSRLQKVHNVDLALQELKRKGVTLKDEHGSDINSRDIVDGHRDKTLGLLWKIIFAFHVEVILSEEQLRDEIGFLRKTLWSKKRQAFLRTNQNVRQSPARAPYQHSCAKISLLMDWIRSVCDFYNLRVENFTVAFSDGRVLCYLIHHYHPALLPEAAVSHSTTQTVECSRRGRLELNCSSSESDASFDSMPAGLNAADSQSSEFRVLLENEKSNFRLVNSAVAFLGGVPAMINPSDMSNTIPNEKVVMTYLSFLCVRLLDLRNECRAARVIQNAWRRNRLKKELQLYGERNAAAVKIQVMVRSFLQKCRLRRENQAAVIIQSSWRRHTAHRQLMLRRRAELHRKQHQAAIIIQAHWRMFSATKAYRRLKLLTTIVQTQWRMVRAVSAYAKTQRSIAAIQRWWRALTLAKIERERYLCLRVASVTLQREYRRWKRRKTQKENRAATVIQGAWFDAKEARRYTAALRIQAWYRMQVCVGQYKQIRRSAVRLQAWCRGRAQRRQFHAIKLQHTAAVLIQSAFRGYLVRTHMSKMRRAAVRIQQHFRAAAMKKEFVRMKSAAVVIQAAYRGKVTRKTLSRRRRAAITIQAVFRAHAAHRRYTLLQHATVRIQQWYRATRLARDAKREYNTLRKAAIALQAAWRGRAERKRMEKRWECATVIQACYRRNKAQRQYRSKRAAAIVIQLRYRALVTAKVARKAFLQRKAACVSLQAAFRGMTVRTKLRKRRQAATVVQSFVRMILCKKRYRLLQSATVVLQSRWRAVLLCREKRREFMLLKEVTVKIQAAFRAHRAQRRCRAATLIQSQLRMHRQCSAYHALKYAVIVIQRQHRANMRRDEEMLKYKIMKAAVVVLQAACRGSKARRNLAEMHRAATVIERHFLTMKERRRFLAIRAATLTCQQRFRATAAARRQREQYLSACRAAVSLQAAYRGFTFRKRLQTQHTAATTIQSHFRKQQQRNLYTRLRWAASVLQERYRANRKRRADMHALSAKKNAAVVLQAAFRGMKTRRMLRQRENAAHVLQRAVRARRQRRLYTLLKSSSIVVQRRFKANLAAKRQREEYEKIRKAAVVLQAGYRGQKVRAEVARQHWAATVLQRAYRAHCEHRNFLQLKSTVFTLQRRYRANVAARKQRKEYKDIRRAALILQAGYRGQRVRQEVARRHRAATVLQRAYRAHWENTRFLQLKSNILTLQRRYRANVAARKPRKAYEDIRRAALILQAGYRGQRVRQEVARRHRAATVLQRAYRAHCEKKRFLLLKSNVLNLQRRYRANVVARKQRKEYKDICKAALILQAGYRGQRVRQEVARQHRAATFLQRAYRAHCEKKRFLQLKSNILTLQRRYRANVAARKQRKKYEDVRRAVVILQASFRGWRVRSDVVKMHHAAAVIQANYRRRRHQASFIRCRRAACVIQQRFRAQKLKRRQETCYREVRRAVVVLQAAYRGMKSRRCLGEKRQAATVLQRAYRAHRDHMTFLQLKSNVLNLQRRFQANVAAKKQRKKFKMMQSAAVILQAGYRGQQVREEVARWHRAATVIQSAFRKLTVEAKYKEMRHSVVAIQRRHRANLLQRKQRELFLKQKRSVSVLQAAFREWKTKKDVDRREEAACVIQACWRRGVQRRHFLRLRWAALTLQRRVWAVQLCQAKRKQQELEEAQSAKRLRFTAAVFHHLHAIRIQRAVRAHWALEAARKQIQSVLTIQRWVRARQQRSHYLELQRKVEVSQRAVRQWLRRRHEAAHVIQDAIRKFLLLKRQQRAQQGIVKAQALWRGHCSRRLNDNPKLVKLRQRLREVTVGVREEDKLCNKTSSALERLLHYKYISSILQALKNLETSTRLSPQCCERLVESGATKVIFTLIRRCNRSVPCMGVITFSIQILLNLSKYHKTSEAVYLVEKSVETLLDLLQRYREKAGDKVAEKGGTIFTKACFLLALLLLDQRRAEEVMKMPRVVERIRSIYRLTARKHKLDAERTIMKQKTNGSFVFAATPCKSQPVPKFAPDWVLRKDKIQDVVNPLLAVQMLAEQLHIVL